MSKSDIKAVVAQAMAFLGSKTSARKTAAARRNAKLPPKKGSNPRGRPRKKDSKNHVKKTDTTDAGSKL